MQENRYIETYEISSVKKAFSLFAIYGKYKELHNYYIFRGLKDINYSLIPSSIREKNISKLWELIGKNKNIGQSDQEHWQIIAEYNILKMFYDIADKSGLNLPKTDTLRDNIDDDFKLSIFLKTDGWLTDNLMEIAGLAQHYGLPTRLLDWTYDYKIALFFATSGFYNEEEKEKDCVVWAINNHYFNYLKLNDKDIPLKFYRPPYRDNKYLCAQKGLFTTWKIIDKNDEDLQNFYKNQFHEKINRNPLDLLVCDYISNNAIEDNYDLKNYKVLYKFVIPNRLKYDILKQLKRDMYSEEYLFPGFSGVCLSMENKRKLCDFI